MQGPIYQRGYLLIAGIVLMVIVAFLAVALSTMLASNVNTTVNNLGSMQALYEAESGLEYEQRLLAQNVNWYLSADPAPTVTQTVGQGTFSVYARFPATRLRARMTAASPPAGNNWIQVYSVGQFPNTGFLQIEEDLAAGGNGEFVQYTGRDTVNNRFTGITRDRTIGTIKGQDGAVGHIRGDIVYPVTTLISAIASATCSTVPNPFQIAAHSKFLSAGTIVIEGEEISYTASSTAGAVMTLTGVTRCRNTPPVGATHAAGRPVTPLLLGSDVADYEAEAIATGTMGTATRVMRKTIQRSD